MTEDQPDQSLATTIGSLLAAARDPRYTGSNRCMPCTAVNVAIAGLVALAVSLGSIPGAVVVFLGSLLVIALRGYLVPGTPTLTKRYLPERILRWFDKESTGLSGAEGTDAVERILREAGALEPCGDDLCLDDAFRASWRDQIRSLRGTDAELSAAAIRDLLDVSTDRVTVQDHDGAYVATVDDVRVGQWESAGAYLADVAASNVLADRSSHWETLHSDHRMQVLAGLRLWLDDCPRCGGRAEIGRDTVESCCRSVDVVASTCRDCGDRLFEAEYDPAAVE